jgi:hypothetical protein
MDKTCSGLLKQAASRRAGLFKPLKHFQILYIDFNTLLNTRTTSQPSQLKLLDLREGCLSQMEVIKLA